jgi:hypothetical protein
VRGPLGVSRWGPGSVLRVGAVLLGGLALVVSCARPSRPSGGPRDWIPPMVVSTWPDTFEVIEPTRKPVVVRFSKRLSERPTQGTLDNAVIISPATSGHRVKLNRDGLEISVVGGLRPDLVYRVRVLPTLRDLFGNAMEGPFELVFSTGGEFEANVIAGVATDRITGDPLPNVRVEAQGLGADEDDPRYLAFSDTAGVYVLRYVPSGLYSVTLFEDINRNAIPDFRERQARTQAAVGLEPPQADTVIQELALLLPDTTPARLIGARAEDSLLVRLSFDDYLDPLMEGTLDSVVVTLVREELEEREEEEENEEEEGEQLTPRVVAVLWEHQVDSMKARADSMRAEETLRVRLDSLRIVADSLEQVLDSLHAAGDTVGAGSVEAALERIAGQLAPPDPPARPREEARPPARTPEPRPIRPQQTFFAVLGDPLPSRAPFKITVTGVMNINGLGGGGGEASLVWTPPDPPPGRQPPPTDTVGTPPDTIVAPPDTLVPPPDTTAVPPPDTTAVPPPDTTAVPPPDTTAASGLRRGRPPEAFSWWPPRRIP